MNEKALEATARALAIEDRIHICNGAMYRYSTYGPRARSAITAYLAAMEAEGFVMVPVEVIEDLCSELEAEVQDRWGFDKRLAHKLERDMATVKMVRAMIAARPQTEQEND